MWNARHLNEKLRSGFQRQKGGNNGYTLIEIAVVLMISGLFVASGLQVLKLYNKQKAFQATDSNVTEIANKMYEYLDSNGHYPCPARLDAAPNDAEYGVQGDCDDLSVAVGTCSNGICVEENMIDTDGDDIPDTVVRVRRGAVPFRVLGLKGNSELISYDGFGRRIEYVVTERLASATLLSDFDAAHGAISVVDGENRSVINGMTHMLLLSRGENGAAGYSRDGVQISPCPATGFERNNCDTDTTVPENQAIYTSDVLNKSSADYFDDVVAYRATIARPLWKATDASKVDITDLVVAGGGIGAGGDPDPLGGAVPKLKTSGPDSGIRAQGDFMVSELCDDNQDGCFSPRKIGGDGMQCPGGQYMIGIQSGLPLCLDIPAPTCPPGQFMKGIDGDLRPICDDPPNSCAAQSVTVCSGDAPQILPASFQSASFTFTGGEARVRKWRCLSNGSWSNYYNSGYCVCPDCTPNTWTNSDDCPSYTTGSITEDRQRWCRMSGTWPPPPPYNGSIYATTCSRTATIDSDNTCQCNCEAPDAPGTPGCEIAGAADDTDSQNCPSGFNQGQQTRTCPRICNGSGNGTTWADTTGEGCTPWDDSSCQCDDSIDPEYQQDSCPWGYDGTGERRIRIWECPGGPSVAGGWTPWAVDTPENCTCDPMTDGPNEISCGSSQAGDFGYGPGWGGTMWVKRETTACPNPTWGDWFIHSQSCYQLECQLQPSGNFDNDSDFVGTPVGSPCSCGSSAQDCYVIKGQGSYDNYIGCPCEQIN